MNKATKGQSELEDAKLEQWDSFMDATAQATAENINLWLAQVEHQKGGSYRPLSDTPEGQRLEKSVKDYRSQAREALDNYIRWSK